MQRVGASRVLLWGGAVIIHTPQDNLISHFMSTWAEFRQIPNRVVHIHRHVKSCVALFVESVRSRDLTFGVFVCGCAFPAWEWRVGV